MIIMLKAATLVQTILDAHEDTTTAFEVRPHWDAAMINS